MKQTTDKQTKDKTETKVKQIAHTKPYRAADLLDGSNVPKTVDDTTYTARKKMFLDACDKDD